MLVGGDSLAELFMFSNELLMKKSPNLTSQEFNKKKQQDRCVKQLLPQDETEQKADTGFLLFTFSTVK